MKEIKIDKLKKDDYIKVEIIGSRNLFKVISVVKTKDCIFVEAKNDKEFIIFSNYRNPKFLHDVDFKLYSSEGGIISSHREGMSFNKLTENEARIELL